MAMTIKHPFDLRVIAKLGTEFYGYGGMRMITVGVTTDGQVVATGDGGRYISEWHRGDESGDSVYVERYSTEGREFHGWIDSVSRKIVQTG